jgi:penicillin-binding protein 1C
VAYENRAKRNFSTASKTIIAKEDKYFYAHPGVNPFAVVRAFFRNIAGHHTSGASTITMQVAKMLEPGRRNLFTKIRQVFRAFQLELKYSKKKYYNFI